MSESTKSELLSALGEVSTQLHGLDAAREAQIIAARAAGASWTEIGEALGISKQSAWERYRRLGVAS